MDSPSGGTSSPTVPDSAGFNISALDLCPIMWLRGGGLFIKVVWIKLKLFMWLQSCHGSRKQRRFLCAVWCQSSTIIYIDLAERSLDLKAKLGDFRETYRLYIKTDGASSQTYKFHIQFLKSRTEACLTICRHLGISPESVLFKKWSWDFISNISSPCLMCTTLDINTF